MSFFSKNLKKIRSLYKLNQTQFAELFGIKRSSIGAYEEGRAEPKLEMIIKIANHFSISVDKLVNSELTVNELSHFDIFNEEFSQSQTKSPLKLKILATTKIPLVYSNELNLISINDLQQKAENHISLPGFDEQHAGIIIKRESLRYAPTLINNDDIIIIGPEISFDKISESNTGYWFIRSNNKLYIGEIGKSHHGELVLFTDEKSPVYFVKEEIQILAPIKSFISKEIERLTNDSSRIHKMEQQIKDLYNRIK